jgi:hypothetical protein
MNKNVENVYLMPCLPTAGRPGIRFSNVLNISNMLYMVQHTTCRTCKHSMNIQNMIGSFGAGDIGLFGPGEGWGESRIGGYVLIGCMRRSGGQWLRGVERGSGYGLAIV